MVLKFFWLPFALGSFAPITHAEPVSVSVKMVCIPEVSGGVRKSTNNQWSNVKFSVNDGDRFSIVFDSLNNHSPKNQEICKNAILGKGDSLTCPH